MAKKRGASAIPSQTHVPRQDRYNTGWSDDPGVLTNSKPTFGQQDVSVPNFAIPQRKYGHGEFMTYCHPFSGTAGVEEDPMPFAPSTKKWRKE